MQSQTIPVSTGNPPTFAAPSASDTAPIGTVLIVKNGSGSSITVTMVTPGNLGTGDAYPDKAFTVAAGAERWIPVLSDYANANAVAAVTFSSVTSVTAACVTLR